MIRIYLFPLVVLVLMLTTGRDLGLAQEQEQECLGTGREEGKGAGLARDLLCEGKCPDGITDCDVQQSTNIHGGTRKWCGCPGLPEPDTCHAVIITPGPGEGGGPESTVCAGGTDCKPPRKCVRKEESQGRVTDSRGPEVVYITCSCK